MIERRFVADNLKEFGIQEYIASTLQNVGYSHIKLVKTPLGEKIIIFASRPGLIVGRKGENIKKITKNIKKKFNLENPQVEISEVPNVNLDASIVSERIASTLERFGSQKFKGVGHKTMADVTAAGALGIEILISGKIPGSRAKTWRFYRGYLKKCGDVAISGVLTAYATAKLKSGVVGIQVRIMPPQLKLPDNVEILKEITEVVEEVEEKPKKKTRKRTPRKKKEAAPKEEKKVEEKKEAAPAEEKKSEEKAEQ